jgi:SAM-dependent methyltransferase
MNLENPPLCVACARVCNGPVFAAREMYLGTRESFDYLECPHCGTLQIVAVPADLARHYPQGYYSFKAAKPKRTSALERYVRSMRTDAWLGNAGGIAALFARLSKRRPQYLGWFEGLALRRDSRIVDVGCGSGDLLLQLHRDGFEDVRGLDPYIAADIDYANGVTIRRRSMADDDGCYDLIMLHHSFEHMTAPRAVMAQIAGHLAPGGHALIRLPVAGSYAWRTYREHWFALDPPRHLFVPTVRAMHLLAACAGLEIGRVFFDSDVGQFIGSEGYASDIPMVEQDRCPQRSAAELSRLRRLADELNERGDGDCAGFVLRRTGSGGA